MVLGAEACAPTLGLTGQLKTNESFEPELSSSSSIVTGHIYDINRVVVFDCRIYLDSNMSFYSALETWLRASQVLPGFDTSYDMGPTWEIFRDFHPTLEFDIGVRQQNRSASELWLAAYVGNYIGNCLTYLNEFLRQMKIKDEVKGIKTTLEVKWGRVAGTLGGLAGFQMLFSLAALLYCRRSFEIVDDVSTFSYMFTDFPFGSEERWKENVVPHGKFKFVMEGDGVRWLFVAGAEKDIKVI